MGFARSPRLSLDSVSARAARSALINGQLRLLFNLTITHEKIVEINLVIDPARLRQIDLTVIATTI
jgi:hypothetical protein